MFLLTLFWAFLTMSVGLGLGLVFCAFVLVLAFCVFFSGLAETILFLRCLLLLC